MKHLFFALFSLIFLMGCGEEEDRDPLSEFELSRADLLGEGWEEDAEGMLEELESMEEALVTPKGERILWVFKCKTLASTSSPAIGIDGTVYVGSHDNTLCAINGKIGVTL